MHNKITLDNGIRIIMDKVPYVRSVAFGIWVLNGSRDEAAEANGAAHFIEHMMFKGTGSRSAKDIADEIDAMGGQIDAATSKENTYYYTRVLDTHFEEAMEILCDMFFNSKFDDQDIEKERNVILEEINMYEDTPESLVFDILQSAVWGGDPLGYPILGSPETISTFNNKTLKNYFKNNYIPQKIVIAIAGNFDEDIAVKKVTEYFGNFCGGNDISIKALADSYRGVSVMKEKDIEQMHLCLSFPSIPRGSDDSYALNMLDLMLGGGMSSRLFQTIREERGMCYSIYSHNFSFTDRGLFTIYAGLSPGQADEAIGLILREVEQVKNSGIDDDKLRKTKEQLKSNYIMSLESITNRMTRIGNSELLLNRVLTADELIKKIDGVSLERFNALARKIFDFDKLSISAVGKIKGLELDKWRS